MPTLQTLGTVRLRLRLGGEDYQETLHAVQGDTGRVLEFDVLDGDGTIVTDLTGVTPVLFVRRPDGKEVGSATGDIVDGVIRITIPSSLLEYAGEAKAQIQLIDSANQHKLNDHLYRLRIEESLEAGASPGENLWFSLVELTEAIAEVHLLVEQYDTDVAAVATIRDDVTSKHSEVTTMHTSLQDVFDTEQERRTAESARISAETDRAEAETTRRTNELVREEAENNRQSTFETNETERQNEFETNEDERQNTFEINESVRHQHAEERLGRLEEEYAPKLTEVTAQLAQTANKMVKTSELFTTGETKFFAHRGFSDAAPENTLPAFELAAKAGFWGIEFDIVPLADGTWVVSHDGSVDRTTDGTGLIHEMTLAQLKSHTIDVGSNINMYPNLKIPTLEETLQLCRKHNLVPLIEFKSGGIPGIYERLIELIIEYGFENKAIILAGRHPLPILRALNKKITLQLIVSGTVTLEDINFVEALGNAGIDPIKSQITKGNMKLFREAGIQVNTWTVNDFNEAKRFVEMGIDYITSDRLAVI